MFAVLSGGAAGAAARIPLVATRSLSGGAAGAATRIPLVATRFLSGGAAGQRDCLMFRCSAARLGHDGEEQVDAERVVDDHAGDALAQASWRHGRRVVALRVVSGSGRRE